VIFAIERGFGGVKSRSLAAFGMTVGFHFRKNIFGCDVGSLNPHLLLQAKRKECGIGLDLAEVKAGEMDRFPQRLKPLAVVWV